MDFGALQCVPAHPHCDGCPMQAGCEAFANQLQELLPVKRQKVKQRERYFYYWVLRWQDCVYLHRRAEGDIWQGLYEFPLTASDNPMEENRLQEALSAMLRLEVPLCFENASPCYKHVLTHQIIHARFFVVDLPVEVNMPDCIMVKKGNLWKYPVAKLMDRFINSSKGNAFL